MQISKSFALPRIFLQKKFRFYDSRKNGIFKSIEFCWTRALLNRLISRSFNYLLKLDFQVEQNKKLLKHKKLRVFRSVITETFHSREGWMKITVTLFGSEKYFIMKQLFWISSILLSSVCTMVRLLQAFTTLWTKIFLFSFKFHQLWLSTYQFCSSNSSRVKSEAF